MAEPGIRNPRVKSFAPQYSQEKHDRIRPQDRRGLCPGEPACGRRGRAAGKGDRGIRQLPQRRGGPGGAFPFHPGSAAGGREALAPGRLSGSHQSRADQERANQALAVTRRQSRRLAPVIGLALFLAACGHKQAHVSPPPPPPLAAPETAGSEVSVEKAPPKPQPKETLDQDVISVPPNARPLYVES